MVPYCTPHTFRRTFAIWSLRSGMSIYHLQRLMGHEGYFGRFGGI